jgi:hypothetical protein
MISHLRQNKWEDLSKDKDKIKIKIEYPVGIVSYIIKKNISRETFPYPSNGLSFIS